MSATAIHTPSSAAKLARVHISTITQACNSGRMRHSRTVSGIKLIKEREVLRYIRQRKAG